MSAVRVDIDCDCEERESGNIILVCDCGATNCPNCVVSKEDDSEVYCKKCGKPL